MFVNGCPCMDVMVVEQVEVSPPWCLFPVVSLPVVSLPHGDSPVVPLVMVPPLLWCSLLWCLLLPLGTGPCGASPCGASQSMRDYVVTHRFWLVVSVGSLSMWCLLFVISNSVL